VDLLFFSHSETERCDGPLSRDNRYCSIRVYLDGDYHYIDQIQHSSMVVVQYAHVDYTRDPFHSKYNTRSETTD
jgi:hypothetical protein